MRSPRFFGGWKRPTLQSTPAFTGAPNSFDATRRLSLVRISMPQPMRTTRSKWKKRDQLKPLYLYKRLAVD